MCARDVYEKPATYHIHVGRPPSTNSIIEGSTITLYAYIEWDGQWYRVHREEVRLKGRKFRRKCGLLLNEKVYQ